MNPLFLMNVGYKQQLFSKLRRETQIGLIISAIDYYYLLISLKITRFYGLCNMFIMIIIFLRLGCCCLQIALSNISRKIIKNHIYSYLEYQ